MVIMMYDGARSFPTHAEALAYALAPADPAVDWFGLPRRRRVYRMWQTGRWGVQGTWVGPPPRPHRCVDLCGPNGHIEYFGPGGAR